jgi:hypothetical protein
MFPTYSDWDITYTTKGLAKKRTKAALRYLTYLAAIIAVIRLRKNNTSIGGVKEKIRRYLRQVLLTGALVLQVAGSKV